jgi:hypothetical protein
MSRLNVEAHGLRLSDAPIDFFFLRFAFDPALTTVEAQQVSDTISRLPAASSESLRSTSGTSESECAATASTLPLRVSLLKLLTGRVTCRQER